MTDLELETILAEAFLIRIHTVTRAGLPLTRREVRKANRIPLPVYQALCVYSASPAVRNLARTAYQNLSAKA